MLHCCCAHACLLCLLPQHQHQHCACHVICHFCCCCLDACSTDVSSSAFSTDLLILSLSAPAQQHPVGDQHHLLLVAVAVAVVVVVPLALAHRFAACKSTTTCLLSLNKACLFTHCCSFSCCCCFFSCASSPYSNNFLSLVQFSVSSSCIACMVFSTLQKIQSTLVLLHVIYVLLTYSLISVTSSDGSAPTSDFGIGVYIISS